MVGLLIRHGMADAVGRWLAGRRGGVLLNAQGREEAQRLVRALTWAPVSAVYSSPLERALETAAPLARDHGLALRTRSALTDVDFGEWTGRRVDDLQGLPAWEAFQAARGQACPPGGEPLMDVQRRIVDELEALARVHAGELVAIVTHAEPIRCALAAFAGQTLDEVMLVAIDPARVCPVGISGRLTRVLGINIAPEELVT